MGLMWVLYEIFFSRVLGSFLTLLEKKNHKNHLCSALAFPNHAKGRFLD